MNRSEMPSGFGLFARKGTSPVPWQRVFDTCVARIFRRCQGARCFRTGTEHTRQRSVRSEQRRQRRKRRQPGGLRQIWPVASLLLSHRALAAMLLRRASLPVKS